MKKSVSLIGSALVAVATLSGCGKEASFDTVESARSVVNDNAKFNAQSFRAVNGYGDLGLLVRGDSTQSPKCPQGDGWVSVDLVHPKTKQPVHKLKCSSVSANIGCMSKEDFSSKRYATQENKCNDEIPAVPRKIEQ